MSLNKIDVSPYAYSRTKRILDIFVSVTALSFMIPILPLIFISIQFSSPGPLFYRQTRIGRDGNPFTVIKYRSMKDQCDTYDFNTKGSSGINDITFVGKILRKAHLDEFPQCINVLKGEMSIVGPRPFIPEECEKNSREIDHFNLRHTVLPGITGLAQLNYDHAASYQATIEKLGHDLHYISTCSLKVDLITIGKTFIEGLKLKGS